MECKFCCKEGEMKAVLRALRGHWMPGRKGAGLLKRSRCSVRSMQKNEEMVSMGRVGENSL